MSIQAFTLFGTVELKGEKATVSGLKNVSIHVNTTEKDLKKLRDEIDKTDKAGSSFGRNFGQGFLSSFGIQRGNGIGSLLGSGAGNLLTSGVRALYGHVTDAMEAGMDFADKVQGWKFGFTSLMNDEAKGIAHLRELLQFGKDSPFATEDVVDYAQGLEAVRVKAKELIPMLEGMGGALAKAGKFNRENLFGTYTAIQQILSKRQVSAEEMQRQLGQYIPDPYGYAARGFNRFGYRDDHGNEFTAATMREMSQDGRLNADVFVRIMVDQFREESKGLLEKYVSGTISGTTAQLEDTKMFLFAQSMLGGGDMLGTPGGAYAQYLANKKKQIELYSGPEAQKIGQHLGGTAEKYYGLVGTVEENLFQSDWFTDLLHGDAEGAKAKLKMLGGFIPEGLKDGLTGGAQMVIDAASSVMGSSVWDALTAFWETHSPSKRAERMGQAIAEGLERGLKKYGRNYRALIEAAQAGGFEITSSKSGRHNKGSAHYEGMAIDIRSRNQAPEDIDVLMRTLRDKGVVILDERTRPEGQAVWGGPHVHAQFGTTGLKKPGLKASSSNLQSIVTDAMGSLEDLIQENARRTGVSADLIRAIIFTESSGNPRARNGTHLGLMQLGADVRSQFGVTNPFNPAQNIYGGSSYIAELLKRYNGDVPTALAAYNTGPGTVAKKGITPAGREYVDQVLGNLSNGKPLSVSAVKPLPVTIVDYGNGVDYRSGPSFYDYKDPGLASQIASARNMYAARRSSRSSSVTINDDVPVNVDVRAPLEELKTSMIMLTDSALMLKKPLNLLGDNAQVAADKLGLTKQALEFEFGPGISASKKKKKKDPLFDPEYTYAGAAGDFHNELSSLLGNLGWEKPGQLGKEALFGFIHDIQGRIAHDFSSMITEAIFGGRTADGKIMGGLLGRLFGDRPSGTVGGLMAGALGGEGDTSKSPSGIEGFLRKLFGGFRADGGGMSPGRFYIAGENGPEIVTGPGHVYNNRQTREMMFRPSSGDTYIQLALGDRAVADMNDQWIGSRRGLRRTIRVNARYGRAFSV